MKAEEGAEVRRFGRTGKGVRERTGGREERSGDAGDWNWLRTVPAEEMQGGSFSAACSLSLFPVTAVGLGCQTLGDSDH